MYTASNLKAKMYVVSSFKIKYHLKCLAHLTTESSHWECISCYLMGRWFYNKS